MRLQSFALVSLPYLPALLALVLATPAAGLPLIAGAVLFTIAANDNL